MPAFAHRIAPLWRTNIGFASAVMLAALSLGALTWLLADGALDRSAGPDSKSVNAAFVLKLLLASGLCWMGLSMLWLALSHSSHRASDSNPWMRAALVVLGVAIVSRVVVLASHDPALSDDVYRYVFDGRNLAHGFNPYLNDPADRLHAVESGALPRWDGEQELLSLLAYPEITTPYLPLSQYLFGLLGGVCEWGGWTSPAACARVFRIGFVVVEVSMMLVVLAVLKVRKRSPWWLALYAWHPLAIDGFAASGHQDIIGIALMSIALAILHARASKDRRSRRYIVLGAALLAMSAMVKPITLLAGVFSKRGRGVINWVVGGIVAAIVCASLATPLEWRPNDPAFAAWKQTADWMAEKAAHFGGVYEPVLCVVRYTMPDGPNRDLGFNLEQEWLARKICMALLAASLLAILIAVRDAWHATAAAMFALVLLSTTCHPWYLLWALALFPLAPASLALWTYSLTVLFGYVIFATGKGNSLGVEWTVPLWALLLGYIPVAAALAFDIRRFIRVRRLDGSPAPITDHHSP